MSIKVRIKEGHTSNAITGRVYEVEKVDGVWCVKGRFLLWLKESDFVRLS